MSKNSKIKDEWLALVENAKVTAKAGDRVEAARKFEQAYEISRKLDKNDRRRGDSAYYLAYTKFLESELDVSTNLFAEAMQFLKETEEDQIKAAQIHSILASIHLKARQFKEAEYHVLHSIELEAQFSLKRVENFQLLAFILLESGRYKESISALMELAHLQEQEQSEDLHGTLSLLALARKNARQSPEEIPLSVSSTDLVLIQEALSSAESEALRLIPKYNTLGNFDFAEHLSSKAKELSALRTELETGLKPTKKHLSFIIDALWCAEVRAQNSDLLEEAYEISLVKDMLTSQL